MGQDPLKSVDQLKGFKMQAQSSITREEVGSNILCCSDETITNLKDQYEKEVAEEEDEIAMGKDYTKRLSPFVEVSNLWYVL